MVASGAFQTQPSWPSMLLANQQLWKKYEFMTNSILATP